MQPRFASYRLRWSALGAAVLWSAVCLASPPEIRRDRYGVPHILAGTEAEAAMAHGYAAAEDHFTVLSRMFVRARAQQARYFGERYIEEDLQIHRFGIRRIAEERFSSLSPWMQAVLDGYARGYNLYLKTRRDPPAWATPITGVDVLAHCRALLLLDLALDLRQLGAIAPVESMKGSNLWALGKGRTVSGRGILLVNPHLSWSPPLMFYELHIKVPGRRNVYGAALLGSPVIGMGFNETLGWGHTINAIDSDDVYRLELDPANPLRYRYDGAWLPLRREKVTIDVKTGAGLEVREFTLLHSHYGPVLKTASGDLSAFKSANLHLVDFLEQWNAMGRAKNLSEFRAALNQQAVPMMNVGYADREGNVFYLFNGRIPQRPAGYDWSGVVPGNSSATEWNTMTPVAELPQLLNPVDGYIQNCNNAPWFTTLSLPLAAARYPYLRQAQEPDFRTQFSLAMIDPLKQATLSSVMSSKHEYGLFLARRLKPELVTLLRKQGMEEAAAVLHRWDGSAATTSQGADLFVNWWLSYAKAAKPVFARAWQASEPLATPAGIGQPAVAVAVMNETVKQMKRAGQRLDAAWGDTHRFRRGKLDLPIGGASQNYGAFRAILYAKDPDGKWRAAAGDTFTFAVEFTDAPVAHAISAYSQASEAGSPHFADQSELFAAGRFRRVWFAEADIAANTERQYTLPAGEVP